MNISRFEDIVAWQKSQVFAVSIYSVFMGIKDYSFRNQISRAVISISNNIAEGYERSSKADFARFLYISKGSCSEVKSMLYLAEKLNYINKESADDLVVQATEISKILSGLIRSIKPKP
jgi:four helix bundle protein